MTAPGRYSPAMALKNKRILPGTKPDARLGAEIKGRVLEGTLSCAEAFAVSAAAGVPPLEVGRAADLMKVKLSHCQLGLFGYPRLGKGWDRSGAGPGQLADGLEAAIKRREGREGRVACADLWELAELYGVPRILAGDVADRLGVRIVDCQLGAF
jgi:hypothetical protein